MLTNVDAALYLIYQFFKLIKLTLPSRIGQLRLKQALQACDEGKTMR